MKPLGPWVILISIAIGIAIYSPVSYFIFDTSFNELFGRAWFCLGGAGIALYARGAFKVAQETEK